ncbi:MAG TPA: hypothetical protein DD727_06950, partial [Clostridiales bacterium]|nr:hypothetical protein [Clostridiales bacterium]
MEVKRLDSLVITKLANFAWLTGGRGFISLASEASCGILIVNRKAVVLVASNIEAERLKAEEGCHGMTLLPYPWHEPARRDALVRSAAGDNSQDDLALAEDFMDLRTCLDDAGITDYTWVGAQTARILEETMTGLVPGCAEFSLAGILSRHFWDCGIEPVTLLIAFDERIQQWHHPLPTSSRLKTRALASVCVRYHGLFVSASRMVN